MAWIDAHNHLHDARLGDDVEGVVHTMKEVGVRACVVNATEESDWDMVASLADAYPEWAMPAFGVHPWKADRVVEGWLDRLREMLEKHPRASVGEVGLDQWVDEPSIDVQRKVFVDQLKLAREMGRAVTIHSLKAWEPLFEVLAAEPLPDGFLMHSFGGSIELAERLIPLGAYFSFSGYFLQERKEKVVEVFRQLPTDRILVETDAPDMLPPKDWIEFPMGDHNHPANLPMIACELAKRLGVDEVEFARQTSENTSRLFGGFGST